MKKIIISLFIAIIFALFSAEFVLADEETDASQTVSKETQEIAGTIIHSLIDR